MKYRSLWIVLIVLFDAAIVHTLQVSTALVGQTTTIQCLIQISDSDLKNLYWRKNGTTVYSIRDNREDINSGNYSVIDTTSLVIPDLVKTDAGNYSCKIVRKSRLEPEDGEIVKLYVIDFSVSHCNDIQHDGEGCSCYVNGTNITSLHCSASGFPHPPSITWDESHITYRSSSVDLTKSSENVTLVCSARDSIFKDVSARKSVCVYYDGKQGDPEKHIGPSKDTSTVLGITLPSVLIALFILLLLICLWVYRRKKRIPFFITPRRFRRTSTPKSATALDELRFSTLQHRMKSVEEDLASVDLPTKFCNEDIIFDPVEPELAPFPLVGRVLFDDLRSSSKDSKKSLKAVIIKLLNKRIKPYKELPMDASTPLNASLLNTSVKEIMIKDTSTDQDVAFVELVLHEKLDKILDETDRDECEILITKPDFQEMTDESQIPTYQGNRFINRSIPMQTSLRSSMNSSRRGCSLESSVIREELKTKTPSERTDARNAISQIILDALGKRQRANHNLLNHSTDMLQSTEVQCAEDLVDENSRLVALWASKLTKLDDEVKHSIEEYLFPLIPRKPKETKTTAEPPGETKKEPMEEAIKDLMNKQTEESMEEHDKSDEELDETDTYQTSALGSSFEK